MLSFRLTALNCAALFALALSLTLATSVKAQCPDKYVTTQVDRFAGTVTTNTRFMPVTGHGEDWTANVYGVYGPPPKNKPIAIIISFIQTSISWRHLGYSANPPVYILADGKRVSTLGTKFEGTVESGFVIEEVKVALDPSVIATLGKAKKIEFQVCGDEVNLPEFTQALHEFACKVVGQNQPAPSAPPPLH